MRLQPNAAADVPPFLTTPLLAQMDVSDVTFASARISGLKIQANSKHCSEPSLHLCTLSRQLQHDMTKIIAQENAAVQTRIPRLDWMKTQHEYRCIEYQTRAIECSYTLLRTLASTHTHIHAQTRICVYVHKTHDCQYTTNTQTMTMHTKRRWPQANRPKAKEHPGNEFGNCDPCLLRENCHTEIVAHCRTNVIYCDAELQCVW
jgi:hypothetical protein